MAPRHHAQALQQLSLMRLNLRILLHPICILESFPFLQSFIEKKKVLNKVHEVSTIVSIHLQRKDEPPVAEPRWSP